MKDWKKLGNGAYNNAYLSKNSKTILKIQIETDTASMRFDKPLRSIRLWNIVNADIHPPARLYKPKKGPQEGWLCPYIKGRQSTDTEICSALIRIYNETGRIIFDAVSKDNFLTMSDGKVVCVDIGFALELEQREGLFIVNGRSRRKSITSLEALKELGPLFLSYLNDLKNNRDYPNTMNTIKALAFMKINYPDLRDLCFLSEEPWTILRLALAFDNKETDLGFDPEALAFGQIRLKKRVRSLAETTSSDEETEEEPFVIEDHRPEVISGFAQPPTTVSLSTIFGIFSETSPALLPTYPYRSESSIDEVSPTLPGLKT